MRRSGGVNDDDDSDVDTPPLTFRAAATAVGEWTDGRGRRRHRVEKQSWLKKLRLYNSIWHLPLASKSAEAQSAYDGFELHREALRHTRTHTPSV